MYNLTVETAHTFFVGDGKWLVHNVDPCSSLIPKLVKDTRPYVDQVTKDLPQLEKTGTFEDAVADFNSVLKDYGINPSSATVRANGDVITIQINAQETLIVRNTSGSLRGGLPVLEHQVNGVPVLKITYKP